MAGHKSVRVEHRGGLRFHAEPSSGHPLDFDDRISNTGGSPAETLLVALATCSAMDVISIATKKRQAVSSYRVEADGRQREEYPQIFTEITVVHVVEGDDLSEASIRRSIELSATKYCPVSAMVSAGATTVHHRYRITSGGASAYEAEGEVVATGPYRRPDIVV
jgi:putative redox protein